DGLRARIERIEALKVADREAFVAAQLEPVRPHVIERASLVLQQATGQFEAEPARVVSEWSAAVSAAGTGDELREAADRIDEEAPAAVQGVAADVERLIGSGLAGGAHDLHPTLIEELVARGLPAGGEEPATPPPQAVALAAALGDGAGGKVAGSARWLQALFRSLDSRRSDLLERIEQRHAKLHELGMAALYDAEPAVRDALAHALAVHLHAALDRHAAWIERSLADEAAAIERERAALEPLARARDAARRDERDLAERMAQLEASYPPV
ncbi:MAG TPA: hypothetical protein VKZ63_07995, partial [Kofleriaceae bacterium]|nr:hypothetical protein [Kofleriaceae bacterium]